MPNGSGSSSRRPRPEPRFWAAVALLFALLVWAGVRLIPPPAAPATLGPVEIPAVVIPIEFKVAGKLDINRATAAELQTLPGIGPTLAARIVAFRDENGPFAGVDDLVRVPGIGPKTVAALRDLVTVGAGE